MLLLDRNLFETLLRKQPCAWYLMIVFRSGPVPSIVFLERTMPTAVALCLHMNSDFWRAGDVRARKFSYRDAEELNEHENQAKEQ